MYLIRTPIGIRLATQHDAEFWLIEKRADTWPQRVWNTMKDMDLFLKKHEPAKAPGPEATR